MSRTRDLEFRYAVDRAQAEALLVTAGRRLGIEIHDGERPISYSRTLYLDTADGRYLRSSATSGTRVRLRQYASASGLRDRPRVATGVFLELKRRVGVQRQKLRVELPDAAVEGLLDGRLGAASVAALERGAMPVDLLEELDRGLLVPRLMTWYRRLSLFGIALRVTLDQAIAYCAPEAPRYRGAPAEPLCVLACDRRMVLEVKPRTRMPPWLDCAVRSLTPAVHSKVRVGAGVLSRAAVSRLEAVSKAATG